MPCLIFILTHLLSNQIKTNKKEG
uniref:Uncharacterized protein n=1 Tax=Rhizophora mucronata TaxID=61149 RepID=A0A2P2QTA4_RHIMU